MERLLPSLKTPRARHEMSWRLATLEFNHLNKPEKSLQTMQAVVKETRTDADSMAQKFRDSYGAMCFNQGQQMLAARKFSTALAYFQQSAEIDWNYRAKSYLELARLAANDPKRAEEFAKQALASAQQLNPKEEITVHELLTQALKRQGKFDEARRQFEKYRELNKRLPELTLGMLLFALGWPVALWPQQKASVDQKMIRVATVTDRGLIDFFLMEFLITDDPVTKMEIIDATANGFGVEDIVKCYPSERIYVPTPSDTAQTVMNAWRFAANFQVVTQNSPGDF
jgi:tetratricopeptide (TPR) repeat protein